VHHQKNAFPAPGHSIPVAEAAEDEEGRLRGKTSQRGRSNGSSRSSSGKGGGGGLSPRRGRSDGSSCSSSGRRKNGILDGIHGGAGGGSGDGDAASTKSVLSTARDLTNAMNRMFLQAAASQVKAQKGGGGLIWARID